MAGKLSTHVLDIHHGCPAAGVAIELWECGAGRPPKLLKSVLTNADGRTGEPLLAGDDFRAGTFELRFQVGAYFEKMKTPLPARPFLGEVPVRFTVADEAAAYHVPLVVSPWAYSTYRGS
jgi:hydroxyisourate hydrolase